MSIDMSDEKNEGNIIRMCSIVESYKRIWLLQKMQQPFNLKLENSNLIRNYSLFPLFCTYLLNLIRIILPNW